jgi:type IV secretory pathway TrbD component
MDIWQVLKHRSLTRPVFLGGAGAGDRQRDHHARHRTGAWLPLVGHLLAAFLATAVHMLLRRMARRDPQFFAVYLRHLSYEPDYRHFPDPHAPPARIYRSLEPYKWY